MIGKIITSFRGSKLWVEALEYCQTRNYQKAQPVLLKMERIGAGRNIEHLLLRGFIEYILLNYQESAAYLELAIEKIKVSTKREEKQKEYLVCYAKSILNDIIKDKTLIRYENVDLDSIPKDIKEKFPLIEHPDWKK